MKTYLSRAQSRFWSAEMPVGDPTGGPAFGEKNDPISIASSVAGSVLTSAITGGGSSGGGGQAGAISTYAADTGANIANDQWNYYKANYQPLESNLINQAAAAGSPEEFARNRGVARADVAGAFDAARKQSASRMASYGINPGSPAFQSGMASSDLAEGATTAGALTAADTNTRNLAYSKALDVVGLGRNIPAQSAASSANAANAATAASRNLFAQNAINRQNVGLAVSPIAAGIGKAAGQWFGNSNANYNSNGTIGNPTTYGDTYSLNDPAYGATGGKVTPKGFMRYARGGLVGKHPITPHMRYAGGGGVGRRGLEAPVANDAGATIDNETGQVIGPGTGTSDSVPAMIDGQKPAAISSGEFVMNAEVPKMTGDEILEAINKAGLKKRQQAGLGPRDSNDVPEDAGSEAYAEGREVQSDEAQFQTWYAGHAKARGLNPNPDDPQHFYDYRAAYRAGAKPDSTGHWPSEFKREGHPRMVVDGVNTKTGKPAYADGGAVQADVRKSEPDQHGRPYTDPAHGETRSDAHWQGQAHIDHISSRASHAAQLERAGKLKGSGYEGAERDFDAHFGPGSYREFHKYARGGRVTRYATAGLGA